MFVVMLLSLSRAIVILFPFYKVNKAAIYKSIFAYFIYHCIWNTLYITLSGYAHYDTATGLCLVYSDSLFYDIFRANYSICLGIPPLAVFLSFMASIIKLLRENIMDESQKRNRKASITITYFSVTFLLCNSVSFFNQSLFTFSMAWYKIYPGPLYDNNFMFFYSWLLSELFCTVLNAFLDPLLYFWRMKEMRLWLLNHFGITLKLNPFFGQKSSTGNQIGNRL
jgi:hypothetical protein